jgi:hypothetical protein
LTKKEEIMAGAIRMSMAAAVVVRAPMAIVVKAGDGPASAAAVRVVARVADVAKSAASARTRR